MLTKRIVPCLDVKNGRVVKGTKFQGINDVADPVQMAKLYNESLADELVFYDITASHENREIFIDVVKAVAKEVFIPFTVGGGINSVDDFYKILRAGADKISINSGAVNNPDLITQAAKRFGSQCVVLSIDAKKKGDSWNVFINGGRKDTGLDVIKWAQKGVGLGAGEIVINSIDADGVKTGYDLGLISKLTHSVNVPIVASGGAGAKEHFLEAFNHGADAALAASVFHFNEISITELKTYLSTAGIPVRKG